MPRIFDNIEESCYQRSKKLLKSLIAQISASAISTFADGSNSIHTLRNGPAKKIRGVDCSSECSAFPLMTCEIKSQLTAP